MTRRQKRPDSPEEETSRLRSAAQRLTEAVRRDPRVQDAAESLRERARMWRETARSRADLHLEELVERRYRGQPPEALGALLAQRRREREDRAARLRARRALLALAETPEQRRVLTRVAEATPWAGGEEAEVRYTLLLDELAPSGNAEAEMAVHRAIWTLAERRVLAVSPHGVVTACPLRVLPERAS
ncbi:hypothetical protein [Deinococcus sp. YIM 77859]|uniref:hypothetical protein n=1 Tax=Deinococcus sp. YIM 77859 TaxID=1540221 RepID=UPI000551F7FC|nr:hypothetical protein [Deinococcus sp. YIM 77859]